MLYAGPRGAMCGPTMCRPTVPEPVRTPEFLPLNGPTAAAATAAAPVR